MQTHCISDPLQFEGFDGRKVVAAFDGGAVSSDAGSLLLRETDRAINLFDRIADCLAEATCGTIRLKLLKIGAQIRLSVRRIKIAMASACRSDANPDFTSPECRTFAHFSTAWT